MVARKQLTVVVTPDDVRDGTPRNTDACALARAIKRQFPDAMVAVGTTHASIYRHGFKVYQGYDLPNDASRFVLAFDAGLILPAHGPWTFHLTGDYLTYEDA